MWRCGKFFRKGCDIISKKTAYISFSVFAVNLMLFALKLYVGLSSNSISIYSDGVNNLFDSITGILSFCVFIAVARKSDIFSRFRADKYEQLLSFIISVTIMFSAFYFAYNSLERLTYPTPVTYSVKYLLIILATAAVKLVLFAFMRLFAVKLKSEVIRLISLDSLLDFFITGVTVITLILSKDGKYTLDAFCGLGISVVILISAVRNVISAVKSLTCEIGNDEREAIAEILKDSDVTGVNVIVGTDKREAYIRITEVSDTGELSAKIEKETGIKAYFISD